MVQSTAAILLCAALATATGNNELGCSTCQGEPARGSAMLQVKAEPTNSTVTKEHPKSGKFDPDMVDPKADKVDRAPNAGNLIQSGLCSAPAELSTVHLQEARECISPELLEMHVKAVRRNAAMLAAQQRERGTDAKHKKKSKKSAQPSLEDMTTAPPKTAAPTPAPTAAPTLAPTPAATAAPTAAPTPAPAPRATVAPTQAPAADEAADEAPASPTASGAMAPLTAAGFKETTSLCCPAEMELFFNRLLEAEGYDGCSVPHIQGLMHWFTCVPDMDFQYMMTVIQEGNPCKYWTKKGDECPVLSSTCAGHFCR